MVRTIGIDHVGLGSDFDGFGGSPPIGLEDVSCVPNVTARLLERGYGEEDVRKIRGRQLAARDRASYGIARRACCVFRGPSSGASVRSDTEHAIRNTSLFPALAFCAILGSTDHQRSSV